MKTATILLLSTKLAIVSLNKDTIYVRNAELAKELSIVWEKYPIDSVKTPIIIFSKPINTILTKN